MRVCVYIKSFVAFDIIYGVDDGQAAQMVEIQQILTHTSAEIGDDSRILAQGARL